MKKRRQSVVLCFFHFSFLIFHSLHQLPAEHQILGSGICKLRAAWFQKRRSRAADATQGVAAQWLSCMAGRCDLHRRRGRKDGRFGTGWEERNRRKRRERGSGRVGEWGKEETLNTEHRTLNTECRKEKKRSRSNAQRPTANAEPEREMGGVGEWGSGGRKKH